MGFPMRHAFLHIHTAVLGSLCGLALVCAPAASAAPAAASCSSASAVPSQAAQHAIVRATLCVLNAERKKQGQPALKLNTKLSQAARNHARDMARKDYFSHDSLSGATFVDRIKTAGYLNGARSWTVGENIAWATGKLASPREIVQAWMQSAGHRANILSGSFSEIGIGVAKDAPIAHAGDGGTYATDFGKRS
jgi:uncharacterized protein YkwD